MPRNPQEALAWARGQHKDRGTEWRGLCLKFVRSCYDIPALYPSAAAAWQGAEFKHRETDGNKVPRGVPYFWTGGSQGFGHVVISAGGGKCWSNDVQIAGGISLVSINDITRRWRQSPQGWTADINGVRMWSPPQLREIDISDLVRAFERDPAREQGGTTPGAKAEVCRFERALSKKGYLDARFIDGSFGTKTVEGLRRFQKDRRLPGDGKPTLESVRAVAEGRFRVKE
jgi:hypothetical protein